MLQVCILVKSTFISLFPLPLGKFFFLKNLYITENLVIVIIEKIWLQENAHFSRLFSCLQMPDGPEFYLGFFVVFSSRLFQGSISCLRFAKGLDSFLHV